MKNREKLDLTKTVEWLSIGYDHFRHVYEFIKELHNAIYTNYVDYDSRQRISISKDNFSQMNDSLNKMIQELSKTIQPTEITISATKTYDNFSAFTSLQRELIEVMEHANNHYNYIKKEEKNINNNQDYSMYKKREISLDHAHKIIKDIEIDCIRYISIPNDKVPDTIKNNYKIICKKQESLSQYNTDDILTFQNTLTSVSNEYYKIEEEIVHLLYDLRIHLKNHDHEYFNYLTINDPKFWIARSTIWAS
jgi:hypothetical protein